MNYLKHVPGLILLCVVLAPPLKFLPAQLTAVRAEDFLLALAGVPTLLNVRWPVPADAKRDHLPILFLGLALTGLSGMLVGMLGLHQPLGIRDFLLLPQMAKYVLMYLVMKRLLVLPGIGDTTVRYILVSAMLAPLVGIAQYWNLFDVNRWLTPLYYSGQDLEIILSNPTLNWRVVGTMGNPNVYGMVLVWHASLLLAGFSSTPSVRTSGVLLVAILSLAFAVALTQSRSTLGLLAAVWAFTLFRGSGHGGDRRLVSFRALLMVILFIAGLWGLSHSVETIEGGFGSRLALSTTSAQTSYRARIRDLVQPIYTVFDTPLTMPFGRGPSKTSLRTDSHDGYGWALLRFGITGVMLYLAIQLTILKRAVAGLKAEASSADRVIVWFCFLSVCVWILGEFTNAIFKLPSLMALNMFSAGWLSAALSEPQTIGEGTHRLFSAGPRAIP